MEVAGKVIRGVTADSAVITSNDDFLFIITIVERLDIQASVLLATASR